MHAINTLPQTACCASHVSHAEVKGEPEQLSVPLVSREILMRPCHCCGVAFFVLMPKVLMMRATCPRVRHILTERRKNRLAISRERKEELVGIYAEQLKATDGFIVASYSKLTVAQVNVLRGRLSAAGGTYSVVKNTLFRHALTEAGWPVPADLLTNMTGIVFGNGNLPGVAKVVQGVIKDMPDNFGVKGGVIAESIFAAKDLDAIANLPTMDEIRAQLAGIIVAPAAQIAGLLQSANSQVVNVLQAYLDKQSDAA
jgi:large subunit ribosomal protein L10